MDFVSSGSHSHIPELEKFRRVEFQYLDVRVDTELSAMCVIQKKNVCYTDSSLSSSSSAAGSENHIFKIYLDFDLNIKAATNSNIEKSIKSI